MTAPTHTEGDILRAAAAWSWFPRDGEQENVHLRLVRYPARLGGGVRGSQVHSTSEAAAVLDHAVERARSWGESRLTFWTNPSDDPDLEAELRRRGAEHIDTVAVLARAIDAPAIDDLAGDVPPEASGEVVRTLDQVREVDAINVPVWEQEPLDDEGLRVELAELTAEREAGEGLRVLGRLDGLAVGTGGCTIVDGFTRLWGAATLAEFRGRGVYRAVLAERLRASVELGATTALVKGRIATSAPILTRVGFEHYGDERAYRLDLA
ncbi:GNAT family N-acetyltransferase [Microbacterium sp. LBN7]|uniref:GNAT family N-acetyltransferase n=1 Tax=Microbacterium sp. LBN7 TaxID=3129773 RepID=UPI00324F8B5E